MTGILPKFADEILAVLPSMMKCVPHGPSLAEIAAQLSSDIQSVRRAAKTLNADGSAWLMQRASSREQFLVPPRTRVEGRRYCANCLKSFAPPPRKRSGRCTYYSDRRTCSRFCHTALKWKRPGMREHMSRVLSIAQSTPAALARTAAHNKRRWSKPGEREKLSEQNRREWADPVKRALRAQSIKAINGSPQMREFYSNLRKAWWRDPEMRRKMNEAAKASQSTQQYRAKLSALVKERWRDPAWRKKWTEANRIKVARMAERNRGRKQSAEHVSKRVAAARASRSRMTPLHHQAGRKG